MYNYSGYFIFLFVFIKVIFKKAWTGEINHFDTVFVFLFVLLQFYSFPSSSEYKRTIISSECLCLLFIRVITL